MMDVVMSDSVPLDNQYNTGCQLSLITTSALKLLPETSYSLGNSNMINLLAYNHTGELLPATEVKLYLGNIIIKLIPVDANLNCGSAYSFPSPAKKRKYTGRDVTSHSGKVSILQGSDNYPCYPPVIEEDRWGVSLLRSRLSGRHIIFGPVNPSSITSYQSQNLINIMSMSVVDFQEQLLMTISAEKYSDPSNREKVIQATNEKGINEILANTRVDKINNKVSVKYLYKEEKLALLGENLYARYTPNQM